MFNLSKKKVNHSPFEKFENVSSLFKKCFKIEHVLCVRLFVLRTLYKGNSFIFMVCISGK